MKPIKIPLGKRPHYSHGQLLLEGDFRDEQTYHVEARRRHNLNLYGWGVVRGLTVSHQSDKAIRIHEGVAIDKEGRELFFEGHHDVDLDEFESNEELRVALKYEESPDLGRGTAPSHTRVDCYAVVSVSRRSEDNSGVTLATIRLDGQGRLSQTAIDYTDTHYVKIAPGSITATELHETLRKGWWRSPFRPIPLAEPPKGEAEIPRPFRVGATEARAQHPEDEGAAGTMAIPIPPGVTRVTRLRIGGYENEGTIKLKLNISGWVPGKTKHELTPIVEEEITHAPFLETYDTKVTVLDPEYQTLSLWLWGTGRISISLVAVEFEFVYEAR